MMRIILILSWFSINLYAEENILNLKDVLTIAHENNPKILVLNEKLNQYKAQRESIKSSLYPNLTWSLGSNYQKDAVYTGSPKFGGDPYNAYSSDLKLNQTLYTKGVISAIDVANYDKKIQEINLELEIRNLDQNIIEAFYRFILNQSLFDNLIKNQEIIQKALATSTKRYESGRGQLLDILQVKTQLALIGPQIEQAKNQLVIAGQQLINFMGEKEHPNLKLKGKLKSLIFKEVQKILDFNKFRLAEFELNQLQISQLDFSRDVTLGKNYPNIKLVGDYLYNNYKKADLFSDYSHAWAIQVQLNIPLFSGFSSFQERAILSSQEMQLKIARSDLENNLSLKQISSLRNLETTEASLLNSELAVKLATEAQNEAGRLYKVSQIDFLQFLTVQQSALLSRNNLDQLKYQSIVAYSNYFVATGQPLSSLVDLLTIEDKKL
jgi:outer membrane protein TolC